MMVKNIPLRLSRPNVFFLQRIFFLKMQSQASFRVLHPRLMLSAEYTISSAVDT